MEFPRPGIRSLARGTFVPVRARAPLRIGLAGGGTDLSPFTDTHGGCVLNATVSLYAYAHILPREDGRLVFEAAETGDRYEGPADEPIPDGEAARLHRGVHASIVRRFLGGRPLPVTVRTTVDVPAGSGMGGSSALVVALIAAYQEYLGLSLGEYDLARLAFEIERIELGLAGGRQDQYAAAFGGFNFIEFHAGERVIVNPLRLRPPLVKELEASLVLYYTGRSRSSAAIIERQQANMQQGSGAAIEALLRLKAEAVTMKEAILTGDLRLAAETMNRGWEAKKATAEGISSSEIERVLELALANRALAGKVSGAGGGGFLMVMADPFDRQRVLDVLAQQPGRVLPCTFSAEGAEAWRARL